MPVFVSFSSNGDFAILRFSISKHVKQNRRTGFAAINQLLKGIPFLDYDAQNDKAHRAEMFSYSGGDPTVPCIVKDGKYIGSGWGNPPRG